MNQKCIKCDSKLMYLKSFKTDFTINCNGYIIENEMIQFYWVCASCSRLHTNTIESPEMKLYDIAKP